MTIVERIAEIARTYLRDFPKFFQVSFDAVGRTYELGATNIDTETLWIATTTGASSATQLATNEYSLDVRNGVMRLATTPAANTKILVEGYYYEWILPADLEFYSQKSINYHETTIRVPLNGVTPAVFDVVGLGALVEALQALVTEYARDIDVTTSESIHIPGSQRFRMLQSLIGMWEAEYRKHANNLNIGPERIEVMNLRRISRATNRLVPLYVSQEIGDYGPVERLFAEEDRGDIKIETENDSLREDIFLDMEPPFVGIVTNTYY